jgi:Fe-S-cluster containining protein
VSTQIPPQAPRRVRGALAFQIDDRKISMELELPDEPMAADDILPILQRISDKVAAGAMARAEAGGSPITCKAGCGACCRQPVPVSEPEARRLAEMVATMPEPRRSQVRARFEAASTALRAAGVLDAYQAQHQARQPVTAGMALRYFHLRVACPFLENENCSIYPERPLICREYLVFSDPKVCSDPTPTSVKRIKLTSLLERLMPVARKHTSKGWVLLVEALRFAEETPAAVRDQDGPQMLRRILVGDESQARQAHAAERAVGESSD